MNAQGFLASCQAVAPCPGRLKASQQNGITRITHAVFEVMQNAPASGHATGRDNDFGQNVLTDRPGILCRGGIDSRCAHGRTFFWRQTMVVGMKAHERGCIDSHRTVKIDGQIGNPLLCLQAVKMVKQGLGATNRKSRDDDRAAAANGTDDNLTDLVGRIGTIVQSVAVS